MSKYSLRIPPHAKIMRGGEISAFAYCTQPRSALARGFLCKNFAAALLKTSGIESKPACLDNLQTLQSAAAQKEVLAFNIQDQKGKLYATAILYNLRGYLKPFWINASQTDQVPRVTTLSLRINEGEVTYSEWIGYLPPECNAHKGKERVHTRQIIQVGNERVNPYHKQVRQSMSMIIAAFRNKESLEHY